VTDRGVLGRLGQGQTFRGIYVFGIMLSKKHMQLKAVSPFDVESHATYVQADNNLVDVNTPGDLLQTLALSAVL